LQASTTEVPNNNADNEKMIMNKSLQLKKEKNNKEREKNKNKKK
jgi:hypothetical protein